uniref:Bcl-2 Bcl-2 homology region 1-3 domain-containing protein n=1 Tax=Strigamia maritima TaxID=126957 RepID=T1JCZ5_STRMM
MGDNRTVEMNEETRSLVQDFIIHSMEERGVAVPQPPLRSPTPLSRKLRQVTCEFEQKNRTSLDEMFVTLQEQGNQQMEVNAHLAFQGVINELFREGITWSRIVAMFAFAGGLAVRFTQDLDQIVEDLTQFIEHTLQSWIADNGGWVRQHMRLLFIVGFASARTNAFSWNRNNIPGISDGFSKMRIILSFSIIDWSEIRFFGFVT